MAVIQFLVQLHQQGEVEAVLVMVHTLIIQVLMEVQVEDQAEHHHQMEVEEEAVILLL
jgi:hypothetical protein